jgi:chemotaxis protein methyltransferase CheR
MSPLPDELLIDPWYPRLKEYLIESTGMAYYANKDADLARRIRRRLTGFGGLDCASYLERLHDPSRGPAEMDALIAEITIGETYFFRHREHFDALRDVVVPDLVARNADSRQLRVWCAGCADGAEPYSLSILLRRELAKLLAGWDVSILGTDINRRYLATARAGQFEQWSFRATPEELRQACFKAKGRDWIIAPEYKVGVSFQFHNLVENVFPPLPRDGAFDLITCRNVLIYFDAELMRKVIRQFHDCLAPGAWLLVGPSEPNMTHFTSYRAVNAPGVTLYQRPVHPVESTAETRSLWASYAGATKPDRAQPDHSMADQQPGKWPEPAFSLSAVAEVPVPQKHALTAADLRQYADQGNWEDAARCGRELLEADNLNPDVHFHYALVMEQMGDHAESERSLRRAIYLDRQAALAHYHLGLLTQSRGDTCRAIRCFDNALNALASKPGDAVLTDADGLTAADLSKLLQIRLANLRGHA